MKRINVTTDYLTPEILSRIKRVRERENLSQELVAGYLSISRSAYRYKELGKRPFSADEIASICKLLRISPNELFYGSSDSGVIQEYYDIRESSGYVPRIISDDNILFDLLTREHITDEIKEKASRTNLSETSDNYPRPFIHITIEDPTGEVQRTVLKSFMSGKWG